MNPNTDVPRYRVMYTQGCSASEQGRHSKPFESFETERTRGITWARARMLWSGLAVQYSDGDHYILVPA